MIRDTTLDNTLMMNFYEIYGTVLRLYTNDTKWNKTTSRRNKKQKRKNSENREQKIRNHFFMNTMNACFIMNLKQHLTKSTNVGGLERRAGVIGREE